MEKAQAGNDIGLRLFGNTRQAVLGLLFGHAEKEFYQQEITHAAGVNLSAVQRELGNLVKAGLVKSERRGNRVYYQANRRSPLFGELQGIVLKTTGLADVLRGALEPLQEKIRLAFVFGSLASGSATSESDVDLMVICELGLRDLAPVLPAVRDKLGREINPVTVKPREWRNRVAHGDHFTETLLREPKVFLIGDEDELDRLGGGGPAEEA